MEIFIFLLISFFPNLLLRGMTSSVESPDELDMMSLSFKSLKRRSLHFMKDEFLCASGSVGEKEIGGGE